MSVPARRVGQKPNAFDGADMIAALIKQANGRIIIMPGSGVRSDNIIALAKKTGAVEFHSSARVLADSKMEYTNETMQESLRSVTVDIKNSFVFPISFIYPL